MARKILALDIGGTAIKSGLLCQGEVLKQRECPSNAKAGADGLMQTIYEVVSDYHGFERIGVSLTGWVDETGTVVHAGKSVPGFIGTPVKKEMQNRFQTPVFIENDVNCAALGELHFGAARGLCDFLCLTYGTGIGGAIVLKGEIYHGCLGFAGAFGHLITHAQDGRPCSCGYCGCYEAYASTRALVETVEKTLGGKWNGRSIFERFYQGQSDIVRLVDDWINEVSAGLVTLIHIFSPSCILLGGGVMNEAFVVQEVTRRVHKRVMPHFQGVQIRPADLGNRAGMLGAYYIAENGRG